MHVAPIPADQSANLNPIILAKAPAQDKGFQRQLQALQPGAAQIRPSWPSVYTVQRGDTLSEISRNYLMGMGKEVDVASIYNAVAKVARHNGISNPDKISPGQRIDLSILKPATALPQSARAAHVPATSAMPRSSSNSLIAPITQRPRSVHAVLPSRGGRGIRSTAGVERLRAMSAMKPTSLSVMDITRAPKPWEQILDGPATLTSSFGRRSDPFTGKLGHHEGLDIAAPMGTKIGAFLPGVVTFSGWKGGYGNMVVVDHGNGLESRYGHANKTVVREGERVGAGDTLAMVGNTGRSTGPHLHFEVRREGKAVDPVPLLENQRLQVAQRL